MATNNAINLKSSGIASYDAAGTFTALANPLTVSNGGTGVSSNTAYAVLCAGTTSTAAIQSVASVGTSGMVLTSNGSSALPSFKSPVKNSYTLSMTTNSGSPADSKDYFLGVGNTIGIIQASGNANTRLYVPLAGTINNVYGAVTVGGTLGSSETVSVNIRKNNTTDTLVTSSLTFDTANNTFSATGLGISVSAGDYVEIKVTTPAWVTNPTVVGVSCALIVS